MHDIVAFLTDPAAVQRVEEAWTGVSDDFAAAYARMPVKHMARAELSFHCYVKLLGYLSLGLSSLDGTVVEIGVWKGKSLAFMQRLSPTSTDVIGIDPCELPGQSEEVDYFHNSIFEKCFLIKDYSQYAVEETIRRSPLIKILHIDGGHARGQVWADFLLYERFVVPGGYIVFDDYGDSVDSPHVRPAVDSLKQAGLFDTYDDLGRLPGYEASYVLRRKGAAETRLG